MKIAYYDRDSVVIRFSRRELDLLKSVVRTAKLMFAKWPSSKDERYFSTALTRVLDEAKEKRVPGSPSV